MRIFHQSWGPGGTHSEHGETSMSDKNKVDLKSVSGGQGHSTTSNVDKAKQIVKEELKKESLKTASGKGPLQANMVQGGRVEGRPAGQLSAVSKGLGQPANQTPPICITPSKES